MTVEVKTTDKFMAKPAPIFILFTGVFTLIF